MWPYNDDENGWLAQKSAEPAGSPEYSPYHQESPPRVTAETLEFHRQRAKELRNDAIGGFFGTVAKAGTETFRHLSLLSSGNRAKVETAIAELRQSGVTPRSAGSAAR